MMELLVIALTLGLVSNFHCLGMCGPISLALPINRKNSLTKILGISYYTIGRGFGYASLGVIVGLIGMSASLLGVLQWLSIASGILIVIFAWRGYFNFGLNNSFFSRRVQKFMSSFLQKSKSKKNGLSLISFGFVNAFLPCGMVYVALLSALNFGNVGNAMLFMFAFAIGTAPGFLILALFKGFKTRFFTKKIVVASLVSIVGLLMIVRGMDLGIPYLSPKMEITNVNEPDKKQEASMSCCSKTSCEE